MRETLHAIARLRLPGRRSVHAGSVGAAVVLVLVVALVAVADSRLDSTVGTGSATPGRSGITVALPTGWAGTATLTATSTPTPTPTATPTPTPTPTPTATPTEAPSPNASATLQPASTASADVWCDPGIDEICGAVVPTPLSDGPANQALKFHVPILEYHRVKPFAGETGYAVNLIVPPETFAAQMKAMAQAGYHTITMGELGDDMHLGIQPAPKSFVITFDDGYEDGYTYARPILESNGFVATYFVIAGMIDAPDHLTVRELMNLRARGDEIGNHTLSHEDLRRYVPTPEKLKDEIYGASEIIASVVGVWPKSFCYPAGFANGPVEAQVAATPGLETAVIQTGRQAETWANRLELPRVRVSPALLPADLVARADWYLP